MDGSVDRLRSANCTTGGPVLQRPEDLDGQHQTCEGKREEDEHRCPAGEPDVVVGHLRERGRWPAPQVDGQGSFGEPGQLRTDLGRQRDQRRAQPDHEPDGRDAQSGLHQSRVLNRDRMLPAPQAPGRRGEEDCDGQPAPAIEIGPAGGSRQSGDDSAIGVGETQDVEELEQRQRCDLRVDQLTTARQERDSDQHRGRGQQQHPRCPPAGGAARASVPAASATR